MKRNGRATPIGRAAAVLLVAVMAAAALTGPATAARFLTKKRALKLFYTKAQVDAQLPMIVFGSGDGGSIPDSLAPVGSLSLPAGKYAILANLQINNPGPGAPDVACQLAAGSDLQTGVTETADSPHVMSLHVVHEFTAAGSAVVSCDDGGVEAMTFDYLRITAVSANSLTSTALT